MKQEFVRIPSLDNIEMCGIMYTPINPTKKAIIHVHGLTGNFYENRFVDYLAKLYTDNGYTFISCNNRGNGYFGELIKGNTNPNIIAGGSYIEKFEECTYDIGGVIKYLDNLDYNEYTLEGHSYGCNKVVYYYNKCKNSKIKELVLLEPCDIVAEFQFGLKGKYNKYIENSKTMIQRGKGNDLITSNLFPPMAFTARVFINNYQEGSEGDIFRYRDPYNSREQLNNISIPVVCVIGGNDESVLTTSKETVERYLKKNIPNINILYINNCNHIYMGYEEELSNTLGKVLKKDNV